MIAHVTALIAEAALRSLVLAVTVWLGVIAFRITRPQVQKVVWTTVLCGSVAMPALLHWNLSSAIPMTSSALPVIRLARVNIGVSDHWPGVITSVYVAVALVLLLRLTAGLIRVWRVRRHAVPLHDPWVPGVHVRVTSRLSSPATFGRTVLLPADCTSWPIEKRAMVLAHECAHVRQYDSYIQWLAALHVCLFWFSPLTWWLRRHLVEIAEYTSDDAVLGKGIDRADYAAVLLSAARTQPRRWIVMSMANGCLSQRIQRILSGDYSINTPARWHRTLALVAVLTATVLATNRTGAESSQPVRPPAARAVYGMSAAGPHIAATASLEELEKWYPSTARMKGIGGLVQIAVTLDEAGHATGTAVISESPPGQGFGAAAAAMAGTFQYVNPTSQPVTLQFNVNFKLHSPKHSAHVDN